jgi:hypothetical protein
MSEIAMLANNLKLKDDTMAHAVLLRRGRI